MTPMKKKRIIIYVPIVMALLLLTASASYGQTGNLLGQVTFSTDCGFLSGVGSGVGIGITFDGTNLWYWCYNSKNSSDSYHFDLHKADSKMGAVIACYDVAGGMGALAYVVIRSVIWAW